MVQRNTVTNKQWWNLDDIRNNIEVAFHTALRIRMLQDVPEKQDYVASVAQIVEVLARQYVAKRAALGQHELSLTAQAAGVFVFAEHPCQVRVAREESGQRGALVLVQCTKEGRIVQRWLLFIAKQKRQIWFEDLADFMQQLAHTLLNSYSLVSKQYDEAVPILFYRCILRHTQHTLSDTSCPST